MKAENKCVAVFQPEFVEDLNYWVETERRTAKRLLDLVKAVLRGPFKGIGNPEGSVCVRCWSCAEPRAPRSVPPLVKGGEGGLVAGWHGPGAKKSPPTPL